MTNLVKLIIVIFIGGLILAFNPIRPKEVKNELISPVSSPTEEPSPTPTDAPKSKLSYLYGKASWYGNEFCHNQPCRTANGDIFDENAFTCACSDDFPLGSVLIVSHDENSIEVVCNDRGGFSQNHGRILDLSKKAFETLAPTSKGVIWVRIKRR